MQSCLAHGSTGTTAAILGTTLPSETVTAGGQTSKPSAAGTKTTGSAVPVNNASGAERVCVAGVTMVVVGLVAGFLV